MSLKVIFFGYNPEISILPFLPNSAEFSGFIKKQTDPDVQILVIDPEADPRVYRNLIYKKRHIYEWIDDESIDNMDEEILFICLAEEEQDTYSIMEKLETQRYNKRAYYCAVMTDDTTIDVGAFVEKWSSTRALQEQEEEGEEKSTSPRHMKLVETKFDVYRLYSGDAISSTTSDIDRTAIYWRMLLLTRYVMAYLKMGFNKTYDLAVMRKLPSPERGYTEPPFYSDETIEFMVRYSYFFQVEDPILKGFILAHPIRVVSKVSEFSDASKSESISPLAVGRDTQWLILNHNQFRQELLLCMMKVVASFAAKNGILTKQNIPEEAKVSTTIKSKSTPKKKNTPVVTNKRGVAVTSGILRPVEVEVEEQEVVKREVIPRFYYEKKVWNIVSNGLKDILGINKE